MILFRWLLALVLLPGIVLVLFPSAILAVSNIVGYQTEMAGPHNFRFWLAFILSCPGAFFFLWSMSMFFRFGNGTPAPWDPPKRFVVRGPYRHVRNPMIVGVVLLLFAESLLLQSWPLAAWAVVFFGGNLIYFPFVEEPGLAKRFGQEYTNYCQNVARWIPRITPWQPTEKP